VPGAVEIIDAGARRVPGFVDGHQHFTGGGGEAGSYPHPEMQLSMNTSNGVTTAVGLLGTDALTRSVESLYAKTQAFNAEGLTAFMLTGSYWHPSRPSPAASPATWPIFSRHRLQAGALRHPRPASRGGRFAAWPRRSRGLPGGEQARYHHRPHRVRPAGLDLIFEIVREHGTRPDMFIPTHINRRNRA